jgi:HEPN domain-containing protein
MSSEKNTEEALRWYKTAIEDIQVGDVLSRENLYGRVSFHYHQAGEKLLKAIWYFDGDEPWGHSIFKLIKEMPRVIH